MSRDRKPSRKASRPAKSRGGVIVGIFIGLVLGALFAAGAAWYFTRNSPFQTPTAPAPAAARAPAGDQPPVSLPGKPGDRPVAKPDFEFYKILPQGEGAPTEAKPAAPAAAAPAAPEKLYLQIGAFENPAEADNLKAKLALSGIEASAQRAQLADGRTMHRVRIGPFAKPEDMNPVRARLSDAGFTATVVKGNP
ncbi:SPOR domain-containing protein [Aromatoleum petrolei]|uniref:SPOR domain-containing protein n=1 Tax=Aromatoleum petrolei TaxID=76116 RepID=A0ABX1MWE7_9RHOO|nr:SPOR domain-containing protein [Aromatoleum petrolei]NMF90294.1 SPOR domain-containing protein [Aromatoleum petrolei]QTQ37105.1 Sporulation domain-containing protein [Aromatoleum petrolei]